MPATVTETTIHPPSNPHSSPIMRRASPAPFPANPSVSLPPSWQSTSTPTHSATNNITTSPIIGSGSPIVGKTSQVIDRLTADNDRLRREVKAERAAKDELIQQQKVLKQLVSHLEDKNQTLKHQFDIHDSALARKERRLDDLKATLETEVERRKRAEEREAEMGRKLGDTTAQAAKEVAEAKNAMKRSESAYGTVSKEYMGMKGKIEAISAQFAAYRMKVDDETRRREARFVQLEVLLDQKRQAMEQATRVNKEQGDVLRRVTEEVGEIQDRRKEMIETAEKMRWVMGLHKARNPGGNENEGPS